MHLVNLTSVLRTSLVVVLLRADLEADVVGRLQAEPCEIFTGLVRQLLRDHVPVVINSQRRLVRERVADAQRVRRLASKRVLGKFFADFAERVDLERVGEAGQTRDSECKPSQHYDFFFLSLRLANLL